MLVALNGRWYLIGSIREDVKIHYWHADQPEGPYGNYSDNVLLPAGNYAGRVCDEGERQTLWNFFYVPSRIKGTGNMLPPPKELVADEQGHLRAAVLPWIRPDGDKEASRPRNTAHGLAQRRLRCTDQEHW